MTRKRAVNISTKKGACYRESYASERDIASYNERTITTQSLEEGRIKRRIELIREAAELEDELNEVWQ